MLVFSTITILFTVKWYGAEEFTIGLEELFASVVANSLLYVKPSAHSRFLSLRQAILVFSSCRT